MRRFALIVALFAMPLAGCAARRVAELPVAVPASPPVATPTPATPAAPAAPGAAVRDTTPSREALAVLASIPEPLGAATPPRAAERRTERKPPAPRTIPAPAAAEDSLGLAPSQTVVEAESQPAPDAGSVPVPRPTAALGSAPSAVLPPAGTPPPPVAAPVVPPVTAPVVAAAQGDTCWRVQVGAPADRRKGSSLRNAAESQLMVTMVVVHERGLWKVRTRECLSRAAAESLKARALASGFRGVFLVRFVERG